MVWVILCLMVDMIFLQRRFWRAHDWRAHDWRARCWLAHGFVIAVFNGRLSSRWSVGGVDRSFATFWTCLCIDDGHGWCANSNC